jgi:CubicO group peptidase (beta-lactamase class C family)
VGCNEFQVPTAVSALGQVASWPVNATIGVADHRGIVATTDGADQAMPWASVTKLLTALATLVAVEEGSVDLDEDAGPPGSTLRHLLAHASGLPLDGDQPIAKVGARRIYSNRGIELAAQVVEAGSAMAFVDYLADAVLHPLGLGATTVHGSAAWGAMGPLCDLLALGAELLAPTVIGFDTLQAATEVAFPGLSGVLPGFGAQANNDWGLGFELRDHKSPHWTGQRNSARTFGHFGRSGSFLWVDPEAGLACAGLADRPFGPWAAAAWPRLADAVLDEFSPRP